MQIRDTTLQHRRRAGQNLVKLRDRSHEDDGRDVVEDVDPLAPLVTLPAHVEHRVLLPADGEVLLHDTGGAHARAKHILTGGGAGLESKGRGGWCQARRTSCSGSGLGRQ